MNQKLNELDKRTVKRVKRMEVIKKNSYLSYFLLTSHLGTSPNHLLRSEDYLLERWITEGTIVVILSKACEKLAKISQPIHYLSEIAAPSENHEQIVL